MTWRLLKLRGVIKPRLRKRKRRERGKKANKVEERDKTTGAYFVGRD